MINPGDIYTYLRDKGLGHEHALGWLANAQGESGFDPAAVGDQGTSIGLNQWHGPRAEALQAAVPDWKTNWQGQIDYGLGEPETTAYLRSEFDDPATATDWFVRNWERPARPGEDSAKRIGFLPALENAIGGGQPMQSMQNMLAQAGPGPNQVQPSYGIEPVQREPTMSERLSTDPWLQMGLGILGASGGSGIRNIAAGAQQGLANATNAENAVRKQQSAAMLRNLQRQRMQQGMRAATADPSRIREVQKLVGMGTPLEQARRMVYPTGTTAGEKLVEKGGVVYAERISPTGTATWVPIETAEQARREEVLSDEERARATGAGFGQATVGAMDDASKSLAGVTSGLSRVDRVLNLFESGELDNKTGPIRGLITPYLGDENVALLELEQMNATLDNLNVANLAPVSNYEIQLVKQMFASPTRNKKQNIAILKELKRSLSAKRRVSQEVLGRISAGENIESIRADPPELNFEPALNAVGADASTETESPAAAAVRPGRPLSDDEFTELLRDLEQ